MKREKFSGVASAFGVLASLVCALVLFASNARAQAATTCDSAQDSVVTTLLDLPPALDDFCKLPFVSLCADLKTNSGARRARIKSEFEQVQLAAAEETARTHNLNLKEMTLQEFFPAMLSAGGKVLTDSLENYDRGIRLKVTSNEMKNLYSGIAKAKTYLAESIDDEVRRGALNASTADAMKKRLEKTVVYPDFTIQMFKSSPVANLADIYQSYLTYCGDTRRLMAENAFTSELNGQPYIVMCPGKMLAAVGSGADEQRTMQALLPTLTHELGHQIDPSKHPKVYDRLLSCYAHHHPHGLKIKESAEQLLSLFKEEVQHKARVWANAGEIVADYWSARVFSKYLETVPAELRHHALRDANGQRCGDEGDSIGTVEDGRSHPPGIWRYEVVVRRNEQISDLMGCASAPTPAAKPGCTLTGPTDVTFY